MKSITIPFLVFLFATLAACGRQESAPATTVPVPMSSDPAAVADEDPALTRKRLEVAAALAEEQIVSDARGQWATSAKASSTYNDAQDPASYSAFQATGTPNVTRFGDNANAWCPKASDAGIERLELGFARPVNATEIRVRQNSAPGAIIKVELIDDTGSTHTIYEDIDTEKYSDLNFWFRKSFEKTPYLVTGAKLTMATNAVSGWNQVDAVQLIGE